MAEFTADVFQNEFLPDGGTDVHAVVTVTCSGAGEAGRGEGGEAAEIIIVDTSGSMQGDKIIAAQTAAAAAVEQILDGTWFAIVAGTDGANRVFPYPNAETAMVMMEPGARAEAKRAVGRLVAGGGTAMGSWLRLAKRIFESMPRATQRHAILLTDGRNQSEQPEVLAASVRDAQGVFQCDCRGAGVDWDVAELRGVATALLGTVDLIPDSASMPRVFAELMQQAMARGVADAQLRVWAPQGAQVLFVRQVAPQVEDLTGRRIDVNALTAGFPTGAWGDESRDYHVAVRLPAKPIGSEQLAARVQLVVRDQVVASSLVKALWSDNDALTTRINPEVAHYTGQAELAEAIQAGLAARSAGDEATARLKLGRAVQLAEATGNAEATTRLKKVVDVEDAVTGKVALKRNVDRLDEMALDTSSTKTTRVKK
ncbi:MAG: VWA domain-containing protein [Kineosporiaceae bacterium]|nr:VWA domain-containing protein [Kineosporiaceae bacterium]MBK7621195.1 VWA domain-containing protein [Kineosporiaceae bacterium]